MHDCTCQHNMGQQRISIVPAYPTCHSWVITAHVSLGNMEKQWKLFTRQMIRTCQLLPSLMWKPAALTHLLTGPAAELNTLNSIYTSYQPLIQVATQLLQKKPSLGGIPVSSKHMKRSLLPFLGDALSWLTDTATTKDINPTKSRINQLISIQQSQQETLVHVISIHNVTRYATQINRQHINILMDTTEKTHQNITTLYNIMDSIYNSISYLQIVLHIRSVLANLQDSLHYMREITLHTMDYIDAATTGTLSLHILPVQDLRKMLKYIEETLPSMMHLPNNLWWHSTFLQISMHPHPNHRWTISIIEDMPIQGHTQQVEIYEVFNLDIPHVKLLIMLWHRKQVFGHNTWWNQCNWDFGGPVQNM